MNQEDFNNAYILLFSGAAELRGCQVKWKNENGVDLTIEFPNLTPTYVIVRRYYENGGKEWEREFVEGLRHGKNSTWRENGELSSECSWIKGVKHGKELHWYESGKLWWESNWIDGLRHGKDLGWHKNGKLDWEYEWANGRIIKYEPRRFFKRLYSFNFWCC